MSRTPATVPVVVFCAFASSVSPAEADPIRVTAGFVAAGFGELGQPWNAEDLQLTGTGLSIENSLEDEIAFVRLITRPTLVPGAFVNFSGVLRVEDPVGAHLDDAFALVSTPFEIPFNASPTPLACSSGGSLTECTGIAPFTFSAEITLTPLGGIPVMRHLIGDGTAEGRLFRTDSFEGGAVRYTFEASAVPEPATLSLFMTGAIVAGAHVWRRRRASH